MFKIAKANDVNNYKVDISLEPIEVHTKEKVDNYNCKELVNK